MGKWTDKLYITHSEWSNKHSQGGLAFGGASGTQPKARFRRLPFYCCALSMQPFSHPLATRQGHVFDKDSIEQWLASRPAPVNPATGQPLSADDLIPLHFHTDDQAAGNGVYQCPVTRKAFTDATHIVAIATSGNVFSNEALVEVLKGGLLRDPLDDTPFTKKDIITIQDPTDLERNNLEDYWWTKNGIDFKPTDKDAEGESKNLKSTSGLAKRVLDEVKTTAFSKIDPNQKPSSSVSISSTPSSTSNAGHGKSTGRTAASFTSTSMDVSTRTEVEAVDQLDLMYEEFCTAMMLAKKELGQAKGKGAVKEAKKKVNKGFGYVKIKTSLGDLNIELWCVSAPRTCHNFLLLAERGYYRNVSFHRLIPGFMIQGGDPTGTGKGGESAWGAAPFADEIKPGLRHDQRGLLSMANRGPNTNTSQFFITFAPTPHLDGKHTLFGRVVGGMDVLDRIESIATDPKTDKPVEAIVMTDVQVFVNPFDVWAEEREKQKVEEVKRTLTQSERVKREGTWLGSGPMASSSGTAASLGVGKYLKGNADAAAMVGSVVPGGFASMFGGGGKATGSSSGAGGTKRTVSQAAAAVGETVDSGTGTGSAGTGQKRPRKEKLS